MLLYLCFSLAHTTPLSLSRSQVIMITSFHVVAEVSWRHMKDLRRAEETINYVAGGGGQEMAGGRRAGRAMGREAASTMRRAVGSSTARARRTAAAKQVVRGAVKAANSVCSTGRPRTSEDGGERRARGGVNNKAGRRWVRSLRGGGGSEVYEEESAYG